jgi:hypothetical protein
MSRHLRNEDLSGDDRRSTRHTPVIEIESVSRVFTVHAQVDDRSPLRQSAFHRRPATAIEPFGCSRTPSTNCEACQSKTTSLADFLMRNKGFIQT